MSASKGLSDTNIGKAMAIIKTRLVTKSQCNSCLVMRLLIGSVTVEIVRSWRPGSQVSSTSKCPNKFLFIDHRVARSLDRHPSQNAACVALNLDPSRGLAVSHHAVDRGPPI